MKPANIGIIIVGIAILGYAGFNVVSLVNESQEKIWSFLKQYPIDGKYDQPNQYYEAIKQQYPSEQFGVIKDKYTDLEAASLNGITPLLAGVLAGAVIAMIGLRRATRENEVKKEGQN